MEESLSSTKKVADPLEIPVPHDRKLDGILQNGPEPRTDLNPTNPIAEFPSIMRRLNFALRVTQEKSPAERKSKFHLLFKALNQMTLDTPQEAIIMGGMSSKGGDYLEITRDLYEKGISNVKCPICKSILVFPLTFPDQCTVCHPCAHKWIQDIIRIGPDPRHDHFQCPGAGCITKYQPDLLFALFNINVNQMLMTSLDSIVPLWIRDKEDIIAKLKIQDNRDAMDQKELLRHLEEYEEYNAYLKRVQEGEKLKRFGNNNLESVYRHYFQECEILRDPNTPITAKKDAAKKNEEERSALKLEKLLMDAQRDKERAEFGFLGTDNILKNHYSRRHKSSPKKDIKKKISSNTPPKLASPDLQTKSVVSTDLQRKSVSQDQDISKLGGGPVMVNMMLDTKQTIGIIDQNGMLDIVSGVRCINLEDTNKVPIKSLESGYHEKSDTDPSNKPQKGDLSTTNQGNTLSLSSRFEMITDPDEEKCETENEQGDGEEENNEEEMAEEVEEEDINPTIFRRITSSPTDVQFRITLPTQSAENWVYQRPEPFRTMMGAELDRQDEVNRSRSRTPANALTSEDIRDRSRSRQPIRHFNPKDEKDE